jgi:hypothetical protein
MNTEGLGYVVAVLLILAFGIGLIMIPGIVSFLIYKFVIVATERDLARAKKVAAADSLPSSVNDSGHGDRPTGVADIRHG